MTNKAEELYKEKKYEDCISLFEQILQEEKKALVDIYAKLAISHRMIKNFDQSEEILKKGLELYPDNNWLIIELAALRNRQERWEEAVELWGKAKSQSNNFSELNYERYFKALESYSNSNTKKIKAEASLKFPNNVNFSTKHSKESTLDNIRRDIKNAKDLWEFDRLHDLYEDALKLNIDFLPEYFLFLSDTGQLDILYVKTQHYGFKLCNSFPELEGILDFVFNEYEPALSKEPSSNSLINSLIYYTSKRSIQMLAEYINGEEKNFFDKNASPKQCMVLNYALNKLFSSSMIDTNLAVNLVQLLTHNQKINNVRKKFLLKKLINNFHSNEFYFMRDKFYNHIQKILHLIHQYILLEHGARHLYKKVNYLIRKNNNLDFIKEKVNSPKVAICISGMFRGNDLALKSIYKNLIQPLNADVFIHTWDQWQVWPGKGGGGKNDFFTRIFGPKVYEKCPQFLREFDNLEKYFSKTTEVIAQAKYSCFDKSNIDHVERIFGSVVKMYIIENEDNFISSLDDGEYLSRGDYNQAKMFYGIYACSKLVKTYEKQNDQEYDYIIRCRPDVLLSGNLTLDALKDINEQEISVDVHNVVGINDQFFTAKRNTYFNISSLWEKSLENKSLSPFRSFYKYDAHALLQLWVIYNDVVTIPTSIKRNIYAIGESLKVPDFTEELSFDLNNNAKEFSKDEEVLEFFNYLLARNR